MKQLFTQSKHLHREYSCEIVKIGEVVPIGGSEFLAKTEIHPNMPIVVRKDEVKEGDVMFYVDMECQLNEKFLRVNNQYTDKELNDDPTVTGFFNKNGRVRMVRLRGQESMGYLFGREAMEKFIKEPFEMTVGTVFDEVDGELFVQAYVPKTNQQPRTNKDRKRNKKLKRFDRMIPGEFAFHYDTDQLEKNIHKFSPDTPVTISLKLHGTSAIFSNCLVKRQLSFFEKVKKFFGFKVVEEEYGNVYSSRAVIKNQYINKAVSDGYYGCDIWGLWNERIKNYIPTDITLYCEIIGYLPSGQAIQKAGEAFDYGCKPNESKLMIYRITEKTPDGIVEWTVEEVYSWTLGIIQRMKFQGDYSTANLIHPIDILYQGTCGDLYPDLDRESHWNENFIKRLANDKENFLMEQNEPLCKNKVPREGLVIRIDNDPLKEAFKIKCLRFKNRESKAIDEGLSDIEMENQNY